MIIIGPESFNAEAERRGLATRTTSDNPHRAIFASIFELADRVAALEAKLQQATTKEVTTSG